MKLKKNNMVSLKKHELFKITGGEINNNKNETYQWLQDLFIRLFG